MAILTNSGRIAMALSAKAQPIHLAWGSGDEAWDTVPQPENINTTALLNEIGRRKPAYVGFCTPDANGVIISRVDERFTEVIEPTKHLYLRFVFDATDAPTSTIREVGLFLRTVVRGSLPPGQMYFPLADFTDSGWLTLLEHVPKFTRTLAVRQSFDFVLSF